MRPESEHADGKIICSLTLIHFIGDFFSSFIHPLLPVLVAKFTLSLTQVGILTGMARVMAFVVQPPVGYLADHYPTRLFILGGPLLVMVCISLIGLAPSFGVLLLLVTIGSIGSSMFHPTVAGMISTYSGRRFGLAMSIFAMGGTLSFGVGPVFISWLVASYGLEATPYSLFIGLAVMAYLFATVPLPREEGLRQFGLLGSLREAFGSVWKPVLLIWTIMTLRAYVSQSFITFLPILYSFQGYSLMSIGLLVGIYTISGAVSGLVAGHLSDRIGFKPIFYGAHFLAVPSIYLLLLVPGNWIYLNVFLSGFFLLATLPLGVALAQKLAPRGKSMASSLMMGLAMGTGGLMSPITGKLADTFALRSVLCAIALIPLVTLFLVRFLPEPGAYESKARMDD